MFGFHTHDQERSRLLNRGLGRILDEIELELLAEKSDLQTSYEAAAADAAFAQQYYEDEDRDPRISAKIDKLTCRLKAFDMRIATLEEQIGLVTRLRSTARGFAVEQGGSRHIATAGIVHTPQGD